jgi:hypothetical protein
MSIRARPWTESRLTATLPIALDDEEHRCERERETGLAGSGGRHGSSSLGFPQTDARHQRGGSESGDGFGFGFGAATAVAGEPLRDLQQVVFALFDDLVGVGPGGRR